LGDFVTDEFLVTLAEAVNSAFESSGSELKVDGRFFVIQGRTFDGDVFL